MNISKEETSDLTAIITLKLEPGDYKPAVEKALKKYQHTANVPGFRPGKVPAGVIKKMYGKGALYEEVMHLVQNEMYKYIVESQLRTFGSPLPLTMPGDNVFEDGNSFEYKFEVGLAPVVE